MASSFRNMGKMNGNFILRARAGLVVDGKVELDCITCLVFSTDFDLKLVNFQLF